MKDKYFFETDLTAILIKSVKEFVFVHFCYYSPKLYMYTL